MTPFLAWLMTANLTERIGEGCYPDLPYAHHAYSMLCAMNLCPNWLRADFPTITLAWWLWVNSPEGQADLIASGYAMLAPDFSCEFLGVDSE
jgi:hypothetical protein